MSLSLSAQVASALRAEIAAGQMQPGEKLPSEGMLIDRFTVSRTVVREAIGQLRAEGFVRTQRGSGSYVLTPPGHYAESQRQRPPANTAEQRMQLLEFRAAVESEAAALAAVRRSDEALDEMRRALSDFAATGHIPAAALEADYAFHRAISAASGNVHLAHALADMGPQMIVMPAYRLMGDGTEGAREHTTYVEAEHASILGAIEAQDAQGAAACMRAHLLTSRTRLLSAHRRSSAAPPVPPKS